MRFLVDENMPGSVATWLAERGHDAVWFGYKLRGEPDDVLLGICNAEQRIIVTRDLGIARQARLIATGLVIVRYPEELQTALTVTAVAAKIHETG